MKPADDSEAGILIHRLVSAVGKETAYRSIDVITKQFTNTELAALAAHWPFWGRQKQLWPKTAWRSLLYLTGRGFGKTLSVSEEINDEVEVGNIHQACLVAQDEQSAVDIQVLGPSGLVATSPPWFKAVWVPSQMCVVWPNGSKAIVRTPEKPGKIRGLDYQLTWATEVQSWPAATREEAHMNVVVSTRLGYGRVVIDATPKKRHPILRKRLAMAIEEPDKHLVIRGSTHENSSNLSDGYVEALERVLGGTSAAREEIHGEMLDDDEDAMVKQEWIDRARRRRPDKFKRKGIGIDPAITARAGSDKSGIFFAGLGHDGQGYPLGDRSGKYAPGKWTKLVIDYYVDEDCDIIVVETNKGGDLVVQALRAEAQSRGLQLVVIGKNERAPERQKGIVFVRERHSRGAKEDRAQPLAVAYERGRISHPEDRADIDLTSYEETLTGWVPTPNADSPDDLDAAGLIFGELLDLNTEHLDARLSMLGIPEMSRRLREGGMGAGSVAQLLRGHRGRGI